LFLSFIGIIATIVSEASEIVSETDVAKRNARARNLINSALAADYRNFVADIIESTPHDLSVMGMTVGMITYMDQHRDMSISPGVMFSPIILLIGALLPLYAMAFIPMIPERWRVLHLVVGIFAYLCGVSVYFLGHGADLLRSGA
jgi:hypothetical protein